MRIRQKSFAETTGYNHPLYVQSLKEFGRPRELPFCRGYILERPIEDSNYHDAMGCYPLFTCQDWSQLNNDLEVLEGDIVSLSLVTDPFGNYDEQMLRLCFPDVLIPFKEHFVLDMSHPFHSSISKHHQRNVRKAFNRLSIERCVDPSGEIDVWVKLYHQLIGKHAIRGIASFSRESFEKQLRVPGIIAFRALHEGRVVGMILWYIQANIAYYHLGAYDNLGYEKGAAFALFWSALEHFATTGVRWLDLGAAPGLEQKEEDGLRRFKQGWSTGTKTAYFCGRIFDRASYRAITESKGIGNTKYFPAYRTGEFA